MQALPVQHIEMRHEKAYIAGTGLKAEVIAAAHVKGGIAVDEIAKQYEISSADVYAALTYYYDHQEEIERRSAEAEAYVREHGISSDDLLAKLRARLKPD